MAEFEVGDQVALTDEWLNGLDPADTETSWVGIPGEVIQVRDRYQRDKGMYDLLIQIHADGENQEIPVNINEVEMI